MSHCRKKRLPTSSSVIKRRRGSRNTEEGCPRDKHGRKRHREAQKKKKPNLHVRHAWRLNLELIVPGSARGNPPDAGVRRRSNGASSGLAPTRRGIIDSRSRVLGLYRAWARLKNRRVHLTISVRYRAPHRICRYHSSVAIPAAQSYRRSTELPALAWSLSLSLSLVLSLSAILGSRDS